MKSSSRKIFFVLLMAVVLVGQMGCDIWSTTEKVEYEVGEEGYSIFNNNLPITTYLPGCESFYFEKLEDGQWVDKGPNILCLWEGIIQPIAPESSLETPFVAKSEGIWRHRYQISFKCDEGVPMSEADCRWTMYSYTPEYEVKLAPQG